MTTARQGPAQRIQCYAKKESSIRKMELAVFGNSLKRNFVRRFPRRGARYLRVRGGRESSLSARPCKQLDLQPNTFGFRHLPLTARGLSRASVSLVRATRIRMHALSVRATEASLAKRPAGLTHSEVMSCETKAARLATSSTLLEARMRRPNHVSSAWSKSRSHVEASRHALLRFGRARGRSTLPAFSVSARTSQPTQRTGWSGGQGRCGGDSFDKLCACPAPASPELHDG